MLRRIQVVTIFVLAGCSNSNSVGQPDGGADLGTVGDLAGVDSIIAVPDGGTPAGWLYTSGNKIYVSGASGTPWVGRGVNIDDLFQCGHNYQLTDGNAVANYTAMMSGLFSAWKPTFLRLSLSMASFPTEPSWTTNQAQYKTPMTNIINDIGTHPGVYVLVTLRSHGSMILQDTTHGDAEATGIPSDATSSPDKAKYPSGTDAMYIALVDEFAHSNFVLFGITNEPGGNLRSDDVIAAAMNHAVGVIRAEEDRLGVPHHIVSVQGNGWTSSIGYYTTHPLPYDNVVYEVHGYPPSTASYTYATLPVIIGEYGTLDGTTAPPFFADLESKQIPNLAWDFEPYSNCQPDLIDTTTPANLTPTDWGKIVKAYLNAH